MSEDDEHYDDHDVDNYPAGKFGPYNPAHPVREGFTMGICFSVVVGAIIWIMFKVFG